MAIVKAVESQGSNLGWPVGEQPSKGGSFPGIILDMLEVEDVTKTFKGETKVMDITRVLVAYRNDEEEICLAQTHEMTISYGSESKLMQFCKGLLGKAPGPGYDTLSMVGQQCMVNIVHKVSGKGTEYGLCTSVGPINKKLMDECPELDEVEVPGGRRTEPQVEKMDKPKTKSKKDTKNPF